MTDTPQDLAPMNGPVIRVLAQYARDVSFENPGAPESLRAGLATPAIDLGIDVNARAAADDGFEVELKLSAKASPRRGISTSLKPCAVTSSFRASKECSTPWTRNSFFTCSGCWQPR